MLNKYKFLLLLTVSFLLGCQPEITVKTKNFKEYDIKINYYYCGQNLDSTITIYDNINIEKIYYNKNSKISEYYYYNPDGSLQYYKIYNKTGTCKLTVGNPKFILLSKFKTNYTYSKKDTILWAFFAPSIKELETNIYIKIDTLLYPKFKKSKEIRGLYTLKNYDLDQGYWENCYYFTILDMKSKKEFSSEECYCFFVK